jgi:hypothetical protein
MSSNIFSYIRTQESEYKTRSIPLFEGYDYSQYDTLNLINHYWIDSYLEEASDDVIGDFPFDNISKFRVLLEARATDFDTKHFEVEPINGSREARVSAMIATKALRKHMRDIKFSKYINDFCMTRPKFGGVLSKNTANGIVVMKWENMITDQSDIMAGIRIERSYLTPSELLGMNEGWKNTKEAIKTAVSLRDKDISEQGGADQAQTQGDLIEVYELQGNFKKCDFETAYAQYNGTEYEYNEDDEYEYVEARIVVCGAEWTDKKTGEEFGLVLYANKEKTTQKYLARNPMTGRGLGESIIESLAEHQKWHNFTKTEEMRMIAIAGKKVYWTDDPDVLTNIFDEGVDHGTVLRVSEGKTLSELNQLPTGTPIYQNIRMEWADSADKQTSSFNSKIGEEAKSGTPFRAQYLQNIEASSQFEQYREEIGIHFEEIASDWLLPDALKKASQEGEMFDLFSLQELALIDDVIVTDQTNTWIWDMTQSRVVLSPEMIEQKRLEIQQKLKKEGGRRTITGIIDFIKKAGKKVIVHTTDEARNKAVIFESYSNVLALLAPEDPRRNAIVDKIMEAIGVTKEELEIYMEQGILPNPNPKLSQKESIKQTLPAGEKALA